MTRRSLEVKAWKLFSRCVRLGAADHNGFCQCFTCGTSKHWKQIDAGHWIGCGKKATKYHIDNVRPQCKQCNKWGHPKLYRTRGEPVAFEYNLQNEGVDTEELKLLSDGSGYRSEEDLEELVDDLRDTLKLTVATAIIRGVMDAQDALK